MTSPQFQAGASKESMATVHPTHRNWKKITLVVAALAAGLLLVCCVGGILAFREYNQPPGKGRAAEEGYRTSQPIIDALEKYQVERGTYPASLNELIPTYLPQMPERATAFGIQYTRASEKSYTLLFRYAGPGMNVCTYKSEAKAWSCYGYF